MSAGAGWLVVPAGLAGLGFSVTGPVEDYNGPGRAMLVFERVLERTRVGILKT